MLPGHNCPAMWPFIERWEVIRGDASVEVAHVGHTQGREIERGSRKPLARRVDEGERRAAFLIALPPLLWNRAAIAGRVSGR